MSVVRAPDCSKSSSRSRSPHSHRSRSASRTSEVRQKQSSEPKTPRWVEDFRKTMVGMQKANSERLEHLHPRQPLMDDLKMHFRFGARIFTAASNLRSKWTPVSPLLARIWDTRQSLLINFFVARLEGECGKGIHRNLKANSK